MQKISLIHIPLIFIHDFSNAPLKIREFSFNFIVFIFQNDFSFYLLENFKNVLAILGFSLSQH